MEYSQRVLRSARTYDRYRQLQRKRTIHGRPSPYKKTISRVNEGVRRRVSLYLSSWRKEKLGKKSAETVRIHSPGSRKRIWVKMNSVDLSKRILKEWNQKKDEHLRYENAHKKLMTQRTSDIKRTQRRVKRIRRTIHCVNTSVLDKFYNIKRIEELKNVIKSSVDKWNEGDAVHELYDSLLAQRRLKNGWLGWS